MSQEHAQDRELEMGVKFHPCVFQSLVHNPQALQGHRVFLQTVTFSYFNTGTAIPLLPVTPLLSLTVQFPLPSSRKKRGSLLPLHSLECCRNLQSRGSPSPKLSWGRWNRTSDIRSYINRGEVSCIPPPSGTAEEA